MKILPIVLLSVLCLATVPVWAADSALDQLKAAQKSSTEAAKAAREGNLEKAKADSNKGFDTKNDASKYDVEKSSSTSSGKK